MYIVLWCGVFFVSARGGAASGPGLSARARRGGGRRRPGQPPGAALGGSRSSPWERGHAARCRAALAPRGGLLVQRAYLTSVCSSQSRDVAVKRDSQDPRRWSFSVCWQPNFVVARAVTLSKTRVNLVQRTLLPVEITSVASSYTRRTKYCVRKCPERGLHAAGHPWSPMRTRPKKSTRVRDRARPRRQLLEETSKMRRYRPRGVSSRAPALGNPRALAACKTLGMPNKTTQAPPRQALRIDCC